MSKSVVMQGAWSLARCAAPALLAAAVAACGGGGSSAVRPSPTDTPPPPPPPPPPPSASSAQPPLDAQLAITHTYAAHAAGYTGAGVTIGIVDSGIMRSNPTVAGRVLQEYIDVDPSQNNTAVDDVDGHGTWVSEIAAGTPFAQFPGGIAPGADLVSARIIADDAPDDNGSTPPSSVSGQDAAFFQSVNQQLISSGVKVENNSWGGLTWDTTNPSINQAFAAAYDPFVNQQGGVVVFAAGNDSAANPSTFAALPSLAPELEKGWLTVVAVNSNAPTELASYSNRCGIAMDYCLAAPGDVITLDKDTVAGTTDPTYWDVSGTSFAAPQVSGAAALVWQAFPYFTNDLVRQTILGTADPLGGSQPNATFGYGELDVGKAVLGPAQFNWGDVSVAFDGITSTWGNDITGAGGLIKNGTGTLVLAGNDSYAGGTQVLGGTLQATHVLPGNATVGEGATLDGVPGVAGALANSGTVVVRSRDTTVGGGYTQSSGGTLSVSLGSRLKVTGSAQLAGALNVLGQDAGYVSNQHTDVLDAGSVTGAFGQLTTSPGVFLDTTIQYTPTSVWLDTTSLSISAAATAMGIATPAAASAAKRVQAGFAAIDANLADGGGVATGILHGAGAIQRAADSATAKASLLSLSGQLHAASAAMLFDGIDAAADALTGHLGALMDRRTQFGTWYANLGWQGDLARAGFSGATFRNDGAIVGADFPAGAHALVGYAVGASRGFGQLDASFDNSQTWMDHALLYGAAWCGPWYARAMAGGGWFHEDMQRLLQLGSVAAPVGSGFSGSYVAGSLEGGYRTYLGGARITPFVDVRYQRLNQGAFAETGGYGFGLKADARAVDRLQAGLGLRADRGWTLDNGVVLQIDGSATWRHALHQDGDVFDASFTGFDEWLPVDGVGLPGNESIWRAGVSVWPSAGFSMRLGVSREQGSRQHANGMLLQGSWAF